MTVLAAMWEPSNCNAGMSPASTMALTRATLTSAFFNSYDTSYTNLSLQAQKTVSEYTLDLGSNYSNIWLHFEFNVYSAPSDSSAGWLNFYDSNKVLQYRLRYSSGSDHVLEVTTDGSTFSNVAGSSTFAISTFSRTAFDIHIRADASIGEAAVYLNGSVSAVNFTGDTHSQSNNIRYVVFSTDNPSSFFYYSQIVAATTNTVGWKVQTLKPEAGASGIAQWTGTYDDVDNDVWAESRDTSIYVNANTQRHTFPVPDVTVAAAGLVVQAVVTSINGHFTAGATPTDLKAVARLSGVNYDSTALGFVTGNGEQHRQFIWGINPATSIAWTQSEVNGAQLGVMTA